MASVDLQNINFYNVNGVQQKKAPDKTVSIPAETAPKPAFKAELLLLQKMKRKSMKSFQMSWT